MLSVDVAFRKFDRGNPPESQTAHEVMKQPVLAHHIPAKRHGHHRGMAIQYLGGYVVVAVDSVRTDIKTTRITIFVSRPVEHQSIVVRGIKPRDPLGIVAPDFQIDTAPRRRLHANMLTLGAVQPTD
jgi:hypothetical protein